MIKSHTILNKISTKMYHLQGMTASAQLQAASRPQLSMHLQAAAATMEQQQLTNPPPRPASPFLTAEQAKQQMLEQYVPWVMKTYGDAAKTKVDFPQMSLPYYIKNQQEEVKSKNKVGSSFGSIVPGLMPFLIL